MTRPFPRTVALAAVTVLAALAGSMLSGCAAGNIPASLKPPCLPGWVQFGTPPAAVCLPGVPATTLPPAPPTPPPTLPPATLPPATLPPASPPPSPASCPSIVSWGPASSSTPDEQRMIQVDAGVDAVRQAKPSMFAGDKLAGWKPDAIGPDGKPIAGSGGGAILEDAFNAALVERLALAGVCAWREAGGDAVLVLARDGIRWQVFHLINGNTGHVGKASETYKGDFTAVTGAPPPPPTPGPSSADACPLPLPNVEGRWAQAYFKNHSGQQVTGETQWCTKLDEDIELRAPCPNNLAALCMKPKGWPILCGTQCCKTGIDLGDVGLACQARDFGVPRWVPARGASIAFGGTDNVWNAKVATGEGCLILCGSASSVCSAAQYVQAAVPPIVAGRTCQ